jgi:soluble lytic murein transglycosylase-like protein
MEIRNKKKIIIYAVIAAVIILFFITRGNGNAEAIANRIKQKSWYPRLLQIAASYNVPHAVIAAIVAVESGGNEKAVGTKNDYGLMQVTPIAHKEVQNSWSSGLAYLHKDQELIDDPNYNLLVGTAYLAILKQRYGNLDKAIEAYNDGGGYGSDYTNKVKVFIPLFNQA